jgi:hypothetical protein
MGVFGDDLSAYFPPGLKEFGAYALQFKAQGFGKILKDVL